MGILIFFQTGNHTYNDIYMLFLPLLRTFNHRLLASIPLLQ